MTTRTPDQRPLANLMGEIRGFAMENDLDAAPLDDVRYRDILDAVVCARIPAQRVNGRWFYNGDTVPRAAAYFGVGARAAA